MSRRKKIMIAISLLTLSILTAVQCLNVSSRFLSRENSKALADIEVTPFHLKGVWGARVETANKSRRFFAGIQKGIPSKNDVANSFALDNGAIAIKKVPINQHTYRFEFAKVDILIKAFYHQYPGNGDDRSDKSFTETPTQLNYIVENSACKGSSKDDIIYLNYDSNSNSKVRNAEGRYPKSIFGLLVQFDPK